jgi:hypothetical protein
MHQHPFNLNPIASTYRAYSKTPILAAGLEERTKHQAESNVQLSDLCSSNSPSQTSSSAYLYAVSERLETFCKTCVLPLSAFDGGVPPRGGNGAPSYFAINFRIIRTNVDYLSLKHAAIDKYSTNYIIIYWFAFSSL